MKRNLKRGAVLAAGLLFILLGIIGLVVPFLQGVLFILVGILLLSITSPSLRSWVVSHTEKYTKFHRLVMRIERWVVQKIGPLD